MSPAVIFKIGERVVGTTRSTNQRYIGRLMLKLAEQNVGQEVKAHYLEEDK